MSVDPIARFKRWYAEAARKKVPRHDGVVLATADGRGRPSVRWLLLKGVTRRGFVFYTSTKSRKARELKTNPRAALAFYWDKTGKQVRVEGMAFEVNPKEADDYWKTRPRESRIAALTSDQSAPIANRKQLLARYRKVKKEFRGKDIPRPSWWTGYCVYPDRIEFWERKEPRLHHRELFIRHRGSWKKTILQP